MTRGKSESLIAPQSSILLLLEGLLFTQNFMGCRKAIDRFIFDLSKRDELLTEFDNCLWLTVVDTVTVQSDGILLFKFNDGTEIKG